MKIVKVEYLIDVGGFSALSTWADIRDQIFQAIGAVEWPVGKGSFTLHKGRHSNGVMPIKEACMRSLRAAGWELETPIDIATQRVPGPIDASCKVGSKLFCVEWETGNISSSHRAINKMVFGLLQKKLIGGALILPTRDMYWHLTDRVGNFSELAPYFPLWRAQAALVEEGLLLVIAVEHDEISDSVPHIPKGTDGRALR